MESIIGMLYHEEQNMIYNALPRTLQPGYDFGPHCHKNVEVCMMTDGACDIVVNGETITVRPGEMMVIFPHMIHSFHMRALRPCSFLQMHFQPDSFSWVEPEVAEKIKFLSYMTDERSAYLLLPFSPQLRACVERICTEMSAEEPAPIDEGGSVTPDTKGWKIQYYGEDTDVELQDGWITATEDSVILDYTKFVADTKKEGIILYNSEAPVYKNSSLSFDMLVSEEASGQEGYICMGPLTRVQDGKNCEGFGIASKYPSKTSIQRNGEVGGSDKYNSVTNKLNLEFETGTTYSLKLDTVGDTTTVYAKVDGEYQELASYESYGITDGTYGFRIWRGGKKITISNIVREEILVDSFLKETEKHIPYEDWCAPGVSMDIPVYFGPNDDVESDVV